MLFSSINDLAEEEDPLKSEEQGPNEVSYSITHSISDELIPFSDSPQISRYNHKFYLNFKLDVLYVSTEPTRIFKP